MDTTDASAFARHLFDTHGAKAIAQAAQNADRFREAGDREQARLWERLEAMLREMRGPRQD